MYRLAYVLPLFLLAACGATETIEDTPIPDSITYESSSSSSSVEEEQMKEIVLIDKTFSGVHGKRGQEWLREIGTQRVHGEITEGELVVDLSRGEKLTGWSGIGMYIAQVGNSALGTPYPDETRYGTRLYFLDAIWRGGNTPTCQRSLAPSSSFGVLKEHSNHLVLQLESIPTTMADSCDTGVNTFNLLEEINNGGVFLGFSPSDDGYHAKVTLRYKGNVSVSPF